MTNEDKQLLLKDLCERLPYKVKAQYFDAEDERYEIATIEGIDLTDDPEILISQYGLKVDAIKPYLRPVSDLTFEEFKKIHLNGDVLYNADDKIVISQSWETIDYMNEIMIDYRDLIQKGLALEALEGMYDTKTE